MKILREGKEIKLVEFGMVEVGTSRTVEVLVLNDTEARLRNMIFKCEGVEVLEAPVSLEPNDSGVVKLKWTPSLNIKKGLRAELKVEGLEIYG